MPCLIDVRNLTKTYGGDEMTVRALAGVTLKIDRGSFVAIMGPSGSGKSTFVNILGCLDRPSSGQYLLDGSPVEALGRDELAEIRNRKIGFIFQSFNLLPRMNALENVQLPLLYATGDTSDADSRAKQVLASVGLADRGRNLPTQLSGGEQQRVAIARALINNPEILLADEPTGALDSRTSEEVMKIFQRLNMDRRITIILVTHSDEIAAYAHRIVCFRDGRVVSDAIANRFPAVEVGSPPESIGVLQ